MLLRIGVTALFAGIDRRIVLVAVFGKRAAVTRCFFKEIAGTAIHTDAFNLSARATGMYQDYVSAFGCNYLLVSEFDVGIQICYIVLYAALSAA